MKNIKQKIDQLKFRFNGKHDFNDTKTVDTFFLGFGSDFEHYDKLLFIQSSPDDIKKLLHADFEKVDKSYFKMKHSLKMFQYGDIYIQQEFNIVIQVVETSYDILKKSIRLAKLATGEDFGDYELLSDYFTILGE